MSEAGQYRITGTLGRGAFGTVYRAEKLGESGFSKTVALKILNPEMRQKPEIAQRLRDEARMLGLLRHRAIIHVDGLVQLGERWAVVMEYVEGVDLKDLVSENPVPIGPALEIIGECAGALHVAYNSPGPSGGPMRLLHRDIKPSNVFVTSSGGVKILDFGVARADFSTREAETQELRYGSLGYMSPERLDFIDTAAGDVYALGVVLWELVTAQVYGKSSSNVTRHQSRLRENLDILWEVTGGRSQDFVSFVESLLAYESEDRPLARDVERQCGALRTQLGDALLRDWAELIIGPLMEAKRTGIGQDPNSPTMVIGSGSNRSAAQQLDELALDTGDTDADRTQVLGEVVPGKWMPPTQEFYTPLGVEAGAMEIDLGNIEGVKGPRWQSPRWLLSVTFAVTAATFAVMVAVALFGEELSALNPWQEEVQASSEPQPQPRQMPSISRPPEPEPQPQVDSPKDEAQAETPEASKPDKTPAETATEPKEIKTSQIAPAKEPIQETKPAPKPVTQKPSTARPPTKAGIVSVTGDALSVWLINSAGARRKARGKVPAGSYAIEATFPDQDPIRAGQLQVSPGSAVIIKCSSRFRRCTSKVQ
jgi:serine/threonine protein kinase